MAFTRAMISDKGIENNIPLVFQSFKYLTYINASHNHIGELKPCKIASYNFYDFSSGELPRSDILRLIL